MKLESLTIFKIIFILVSAIENPNEFCPPDVPPISSDEQKALKEIVETSKWNELVPTHDELAQLVTFWCIEPNSNQFRQIFLNQSANIRYYVVFLIHDYESSISRSGWMIPSARKWINLQSRAICLVGWEELALTKYESTVGFVKPIGLYVAEMIQAQNFKICQTIIVGHGLGAHIAGIAGYALKGSLYRIYGLDPSGKLFTNPHNIDAADRLDQSDARYVQCLHTDRTYFGTGWPCGHSDYFANMGYQYTDCAADGCDHFRAAAIFQSSLNPANIFKSKYCHNDEMALIHNCSSVCERFGIHGKHFSGRYYFNTTYCYPYAAGPNDVVITPPERHVHVKIGIKG